jgi:hypothetical protein
MTTTRCLASNACLALAATLAATSSLHAQDRSEPKTAVSGEAKSASTMANRTVSERLSTRAASHRPKGESSMPAPTGSCRDGIASGTRRIKDRQPGNGHDAFMKPSHLPNDAAQG